LAQALPNAGAYDRRFFRLFRWGRRRWGRGFAPQESNMGCEVYSRWEALTVVDPVIAAITVVFDDRHKIAAYDIPVENGQVPVDWIPTVVDAVGHQDRVQDHARGHYGVSRLFLS
jgi:hypothetical protein